MGALEHLKTFCCLGLPPESALPGLQSLLHEIIPHGWSHVFLCEPDATVGACISDNPASSALFRDRLCHFVDDPSAPITLWDPAFRAVGIGWTLHRQGRGWFNNAWYREIEAPLDSCWLLDAMIGDCGQTIAGVVLRRPRSARPFTSDDVERLDRIRPWLGHALGRARRNHPSFAEEPLFSMPGATVRSGQIIITSTGRLVMQTPGIELLLRILTGEPADYTHCQPQRDRVPSPIPKLVESLVAAADGNCGDPPRMMISCAFGVLALEAKWLIPVGSVARDVAEDPRGCLIVVAIELREHAVAYAARMLRESGATPAQVKVGVQLALGRSKNMIAQDLGLQASSVADQTKKLYQRLDIHSAAELGLKLWVAPDREPPPALV
jgi:DNA-binding CsgD family transcriptional regulator